MTGLMWFGLNDFTGNQGGSRLIGCTDTDSSVCADDVQRSDTPASSPTL